MKRKIQFFTVFNELSKKSLEAIAQYGSDGITRAQVLEKLQAFNDEYLEALARVE
jgi:hypothetical protein